ncbi:hypothetical protein AB0L75_42415 [Streptomyces sp. NPDC052101]|uniref:hypothetical protein n=1 Tax=Streptomyces sp. NPDC052101 TaxID=3155763 RepID=UPI003412B054
MTNGKPYQTPGTLAPHIPTDVYRSMQRGEIELHPSAIIPAPVDSAAPAPGYMRMWTPDGREIHVDIDAFAQRAAEVAIAERKPLIPRWALTTAVLMPIAAGSLALGAWGISLAAPGLLAFAEAVRQLFYAALGIAVLVGVVFLFNPKRDAGAVTVTATAVSRGIFSRATATATAVVRRR